MVDEPLRGQLIRSFGRWFPTVRSIWQTTAVVLLWWIAEFLNFIRDPQHIQLCVWLTIYSAVTQPVLGYVNGIGLALKPGSGEK